MAQTTTRTQGLAGVPVDSGSLPAGQAKAWMEAGTNAPECYVRHTHEPQEDSKDYAYLQLVLHGEKKESVQTDDEENTRA